MFWRLLISVVGGFSAHQLDVPISERFNGSRWDLMIRYAVGSLALIPFRLLVISRLQKNKKCFSEEDLLAGDLLTLGAFGTGIFIGYLTDGE